MESSIHDAGCVEQFGGWRGNELGGKVINDDPDGLRESQHLTLIPEFPQTRNPIELLYRD